MLILPSILAQMLFFLIALECITYGSLFRLGLGAACIISLTSSYFVDRKTFPTTYNSQILSFSQGCLSTLVALSFLSSLTPVSEPITYSNLALYLFILFSFSYGYTSLMQTGERVETSRKEQYYPLDLMNKLYGYGHTTLMTFLFSLVICNTFSFIIDTQYLYLHGHLTMISALLCIFVFATYCPESIKAQPAGCIALCFILIVFLCNFHPVPSSDSWILSLATQKLSKPYFNLEPLFSNFDILIALSIGLIRPWLYFSSKVLKTSFQPLYYALGATIALASKQNIEYFMSFIWFSALALLFILSHKHTSLIFTDCGDFYSKNKIHSKRWFYQPLVIINFILISPVMTGNSSYIILPLIILSTIISISLAIQLTLNTTTTSESVIKTAVL